MGNGRAEGDAGTDTGEMEAEAKVTQMKKPKLGPNTPPRENHVQGKFYSFTCSMSEAGAGTEYKFAKQRSSPV